MTSKRVAEQLRRDYQEEQARFRTEVVRSRDLEEQLAVHRALLEQEKVTDRPSMFATSPSALLYTSPELHSRFHH